MLSVIVPTHNRTRSVANLAMTLDAHESSDPFEMVFVLDGCTDGTKAALESLTLRRPVKLTETRGLGPAGARNAGASAAEGDILLFVDDDVVPQPGMIDAHVSLHRQGDRSAVIGPYPYAPEIPVNLLDFCSRNWWQARFKALADPSHTYTYHDCLTGNLSIPRHEFVNLGGLDEYFKGYGREDWEFGVRWLKSGGHLRFAQDALAYHYPASNPRSSLRKWYFTGRADIYFAQKHPEVFETLPIRRYCRRNGHLWAYLKALLPILLPCPMKTISLMGYFFECNLDRLWDKRIFSLWRRSEDLAHLLGMVSAVGGIRRFEEFLENYIARSEWPSRAVSVKDLDLHSAIQEFGEMDRYDGLYMISRAGKTILDWIEIPCRQGRASASSAEIAERVSDHAKEQSWHSLVVPAGLERPTSEIDILAQQQLRDKLTSLAAYDLNALASTVGRERETHPRLSVIVFAENEDEISPEAYSDLVPAQVMHVPEEGWELEKAISACEGEIIAFLRPQDQLDPAWADTAFRHFHDPQVACVVSPAIPRNMHTREEELYGSLVDLHRVRTWKSCDLSGWRNPAYMLSEFNMGCHRLVVSKAALKAHRNLISVSSDNHIEAFLRIFSTLMLEWEKVVYEPKAIIWCDPSISPAREIASAHSYAVGRLISEKIVSGPGGRIRALRMLPRLALYHARRLKRCASGRIDWPVISAAENAAACVRGMFHALR